MFSIFKFKKVTAVVVLLSLFAFSSAVHAATIVTGGSTVTSSLMESCRLSFAGDSTANSLGHRLDYTPVGSGTGRANFLKGDYKFAMSGKFWSNSEITTAQGTSGGATRTASNFLFIPMVATPIGVVYNLNGVKPAGTAIKMSSETLAKIFAGTVTKWNDPVIAADNPPITQVNAAIQQKAQPKLSALKGQFKATLAKTKNSNKAILSVEMSSALLAKTTKNLVVTSSVNENKPAKKIFNEKPKRRTFSLTVTYQKGSVYGLKFDGKTLGEVSVDPKTVAVPDSAVAIELPDAPITVIKRKDFSDTTLHFTNYLNKAQPTIWSRSANDAFDSAFPGTVPTSFVSAQGNDGVLNEVIARAGSIGYAELAYINERVFSGSQIGIAKIRNGAGEFVAVSSAGTKLSLSAAAVDETSGVVTPNYDNTVSGAYPITMVTYGLANTSGFGTTADNAIAKTYVNYFLDTCVPTVARIKGYVELPDNILSVSKSLAARIGS